MGVTNDPLKGLGYGMFAVGASSVNLDSGSLVAGMNMSSLAASAVKCTRAEIVPEVAIRFRLDSVAPTATVGTPLAAGAQYILDADPHEFRMIAQSGTGGVSVNFLGTQ